MRPKSIDNAFTAKTLTGAATDPTHAGAASFMRRRYTKTLKGADAVAWGIPFDAAVSNRPGAPLRPAGGPSTAKMLSVPRQPGALDVVGADVVEVAPAHDDFDITAIAGATMAMHYLGLLAEKRAQA